MTMCDYEKEAIEQRERKFFTRTIHTQTAVDYECAIALRVYSYLYRRRTGDGRVCGSGRHCLVANATFRAHFIQIFSVAHAANSIRCQTTRSLVQTGRLFTMRSGAFWHDVNGAPLLHLRCGGNEYNDSMLAVVSEGESVREFIQ